MMASTLLDDLSNKLRGCLKISFEELAILE